MSQSGMCRGARQLRSSLCRVRELRAENERKKSKPKEKPRAAKPAAFVDPRFQPFFAFSFEDFRMKKGQPPTWAGKGTNALKEFLKRNAVTLEEWRRRWLNFSASTEPFTVRKGLSLAYFCSNFDEFINGPLGGGNNGMRDGHREPRAAVAPTPGKYPAATKLYN